MEFFIHLESALLSRPIRFELNPRRRNVTWMNQPTPSIPEIKVSDCFRPFLWIRLYVCYKKCTPLIGEFRENLKNGPFCLILSFNFSNFILNFDVIFNLIVLYCQFFVKFCFLCQIGQFLGKKNNCPNF